MMRVGLGYDIHRLASGRPLLLGGIRLPYKKGLQGHSDADALLHAIIDALLGAAGLPDIGHYFPPSDPQFKGIASAQMLDKVMSEITRQGWRVANVDTVVIAEEPKLSPHRDAMRQKIARLLGIATETVQVKGKTNEGLGEIGKGQAIAAHAVVLLQRDSPL